MSSYTYDLIYTLIFVCEMHHNATLALETQKLAFLLCKLPKFPNHFRRSKSLEEVITLMNSEVVFFLMVTELLKIRKRVSIYKLCNAEILLEKSNTSF